MALIRLAYRRRPADAGRGAAQARRDGRAPPRLRRRRRRAGAGARAARSSGGSALRAPRLAPGAPRRRRAGRRGPRLARFEDVVALARAKRDVQLEPGAGGRRAARALRAGRIEFSLVDGASPGSSQTLSRRLSEWTGERWMVALAAGATAPTLREQATARRKRAAERRRRRTRWCARFSSASPAPRSSTCAAPTRRPPRAAAGRRRRGRLRGRA